MKKLLKWVLIAFVVLFLVSFCAMALESPEDKEARAQKKIPDAVLKFKYDKKSYPKLYKAWGNDGMEKVNGLIPDIALHVAKSATCDKVESVDVSDERSSPKDKLAVFFVDCTNGKRFFVSEGDLSGDKAVAEQDKHFDKSAAIAKCDDAIKRKLNHPATFNQHVTDTSAARNENGNIMIVRGFSAKNGLGIEVDYRANCIISNGRVDLHIDQK